MRPIIVSAGQHLEFSAYSLPDAAPGVNNQVILFHSDGSTSYANLPNGFAWRGDWNTGNSYVVNDIVRHAGGIWRAKDAVPAEGSGTTPADVSDYWDPWAANGTDGSDGTQWTTTGWSDPNGEVSGTSGTLVLCADGSVWMSTGGTSWTFSGTNLKGPPGDPGLGFTDASLLTGPLVPCVVDYAWTYVAPWLLPYSDGALGNWDGAAPATLQAAIERLAALVKTLNSGTGA